METRQRPVSRKVLVSVDSLREIRRLVEGVGKRIHSDGRMHVADKRITLSMLSGVKRVLDDALQLQLFSPEQIDSR